MNLRDIVTEALEDIVLEAAEKAIKAGRFDKDIARVICDAVREGPKANQEYTEVGFLLRMAVEVIDRSSTEIAFSKAKAIASQAYHEFKHDNSVKFGDSGWDWSESAAVEIIELYEIDYWEAAA